MTSFPRSPRRSPAPGPDGWTKDTEQGYALHASAGHRQAIAQRTVQDFAGFFTPHLRAGMRLLDCGCGPGSMTLDFAGLLAPGDVVGIDIGADEIAAARALAQERGAANARFSVANAYALPFADASFDAAFAQTLLVHLSDPLAALREMRRVVRAGGVIGLQDSWWGAMVMEPATPLLDLHRALTVRTLELHGGSPLYATRQRRLLLEAGCTRAEAWATLAGNACGTPAETRRAAAYSALLLRETVSKAALEQGWADQDTLSAIEAELGRWGDAPDSFGFVVTCQAVGWV